VPWTLGGITIHPPGGGYQERRESLYAIQQVLDATAETISYYGAGSLRTQLRFILDEDVNGNTGLNTLRTAVGNNSDVALVGDVGSLGNHRILSLNASRLQDHVHTNPVYDCTAELIKV